MNRRLEGFWDRLAQGLVHEQAAGVPPNARVGAVLVLIQETSAGPELVLTRRRRDLRSHPGQIAFAGGRRDPGESVRSAALREAAEEIGLRADSAEVLGVAPVLYIPPSRFWIAPVVARWRQPHPTRPSPFEVDAIIPVPVAHLLDPEHWRRVPRSGRGSAWAWQLDTGDLLWGATAGVVAALLDVALPDWSAGRRPEDLPADRTVRPWEDAPAWQRRARLGGELPSVPQDEVVHVTADQMRSVERLLTAEGIGSLPLAEQAGRGIAHAVRRLAGGELADLSVTVLAGAGGNGEGGAAAARLLAAAGAHVEVLLTAPLARHATPGGEDPPPWMGVLVASGIPVHDVDDRGVPESVVIGEVVVDAMLGRGLTTQLDGPAAAANAWLQRHDVPVVSLRLPSGLDADVGLVGPCVSADVTVALGAPHPGLLPTVVHPYVGDLYLADIGIPPAVWRRVGVDAPPVFPRGALVRLTAPATTDAGTPDQLA